MFQNKKTPSILRIYPNDNIYFLLEKTYYNKLLCINYYNIL